MNVKIVFFNVELQKEIYIRSSEFYFLSKEKAWKMLKALYDFKQSFKTWYVKFFVELKNLKFKSFNLNQCVFVNDKNKFIVIVHVNDIRIFESNESFIKIFKISIRKIFDMIDENEISCYFDMHVKHTNDDVIIHQSIYVRKILNRFQFQNLLFVKTFFDFKKRLQKEIDIVASDAKKHLYLSMFEFANYFFIIIKFDFAHAISIIEKYNSNSNQNYINVIKRIYVYLIDTSNWNIHYFNVKKHQDVKIVEYIDFDYDECSNIDKSITSWIFTMTEKSISWYAKRQQSITMSSCETKYIVDAETVKEIL